MSTQTTKEQLDFLVKQLDRLTGITQLMKSNNGINQTIAVSLEELVYDSINEKYLINSFTSDFSHINLTLGLESIRDGFDKVCNQLKEIVNSINQYYVTPPDPFTELVPLSTTVSIEEFSKTLEENKWVIKNIIEDYS